MAKSLREHLDILDQEGLIKWVEAEVDKDWELACVARWIYQAFPEEERFALRFQRVKGYETPVVAGVLGANRTIYALAMNTTPDNIRAKWAEALANPLPPKLVAGGPVKENVIKGDQVDITKFPQSIWTPQRDTTPYITSASVVTRDLETGRHNIGTYRQQVKGPQKMGSSINPTQHIGKHLAKYRARKQDMPMAVVIGSPPALGLAQVSKVPAGLEEYAVAGALMGEPLELVKCETLDLHVPAQAEIVFEGLISWDKTEPEGPFGEYTGYMGIARDDGPIFNIHCITHRNNPIWQDYVSQMPPSESSTIRGLGQEGMLYKHLINDLGLTFITDFCLTEASGNWRQLVVQLAPQYPGQARNTIQLIGSLLEHSAPKVIIAVDEDIDPRDPFAVNWALVFRANPKEDVAIDWNRTGDVLDPCWIPADRPRQERLGKGSNLLIDATIKHKFPEIALPPKEPMMKVYENWLKYKLPPFEVPERTKRFLDHHPVQEYYLPFKKK